MAKPESSEPLFDIVYTCRAMRRFKPDPIPEPLLLQLVDAALQGPSGSNAQNWTFIIVGAVILIAVVLDQVVHIVQAKRRILRATGIAESDTAPPTPAVEQGQPGPGSL